MERIFVILLSALALASGGPARAASQDVLRLGKRAFQAAELHLEALKRSRRAPQVAAYGTVLDPAVIAVQVAALAAARSKLAADAANENLDAAAAARAHLLYRTRSTVPLADLQKAEAKLAVAKADEALTRANLAEEKARIRAAWGPALAAAMAANSAPLPALATGKERLVQVSLPLGARFSDPPPNATAIAPDGARLALKFVSRSPRIPVRIAGQTSFYLMQRTNSAPIGTPLVVLLATARPQTGVVVPLSAVIWNGGRAFVYRQIGPRAFAAVPITTAMPSPGGYFVPKKPQLSAGTKIVTRGAALLLSAAQFAKSPEAEVGDGDDGD